MTAATFGSVDPSAATPATTVEVLPPGLAGAAGADVLAVPVWAGTGGSPAPDDSAVEALTAYGTDPAAVVATERVKGRPGEVVRVPVQAPAGLPARLLLVGVGQGRSADLRRAAAALARAVRGRDRLATTIGAGTGAEGARAVVEGLLLGGYAPPAAGTRDRSDAEPVHHAVLAGRYPEAGVNRGLLSGAAARLARDLANVPSDVKDPQWMADQAGRVAERAGLRIRVWDADQLARDGFGALLAVGGGSVRPPRLVRLDYVPDVAGAGRSRRPVVLVGKGITYDTGGLSIKLRESMVAMKTDMAGSAAVLAALSACRDLGVRRPVTGLLALAENAVGGTSYRPGDVVRHYGGRTSEILNTDAEGRLVLADALAYAVDALDPEVLVDVATLTGAATLGLGRRYAPLYATDDRLAAALVTAGEAVGERVWRMPLVEDYRRALDSPVADLCHVSVDKRLGGGSITAALFLREFVAGRRWAHLDIAGTGRSEKDDHEISRGATGFGARLLLRWLETLR
ncbi:MAG TPA: leucyl aminopeptidase family protein [Kineosporiaceae bacterium]|nr:leucyl aminopeptidase family protein [Kineosporiaceae bacterium]